MRTVVVKACNLKVGDVLTHKSGKGQRIVAKHLYVRRNSKVVTPVKDDYTGVLVIAPNPNGYKPDTIKFRGGEKIKVRRPIKNMSYAKKKA